MTFIGMGLIGLDDSRQKDTKTRDSKHSETKANYLSLEEQVEETLKKVKWALDGYCTVCGMDDPHDTGYTHQFGVQSEESIIKQALLTAEKRERELEKGRAIIVMQQFIAEKGEDYPLGKYLDMLLTLTNLTKE